MEHGPPLDPALAAEIERRIVSAAATTLDDRVVAVISKGSAINGDFIPYFSDFDIHIYVDSVAMSGPHALLPGPTLRFQELVGDIDPEEFQVSQVQVNFLSASAPPKDWLPPVPGTCRVALGRTPQVYPALDAAEFSRHAHRSLARLDELTDTFLTRIVDKPNHQLAPVVRLMGTFLKPALRQAATLLGAPPIDVWKWPQARVLALIEPDVISDRSASAFLEKARHWRTTRSDARCLRSMIVDALNAYEALSAFGKRQHYLPTLVNLRR